MEGGGGGATLSDIYGSSKRLLLRARDGIEHLERLDYSTTMDSTDLSSAVKKDITKLRSLCSEMDHLWRSISARPQRDLWKR